MGGMIRPRGVTHQKVWTSGAHHADVLLTFVRTEPDAPTHKGISVLLIPTDSPGVALCALLRGHHRRLDVGSPAATSSPSAYGLPRG